MGFNTGDTYGWELPCRIGSDDRRANIDESIDCFRLAIEIYTRESMPYVWAMTQIDMGLGLHIQLSVDRRMNRDKAIEHYQLALQIYMRELMPYQWART